MDVCSGRLCLPSSELLSDGQTNSWEQSGTSSAWWVYEEAEEKKRGTVLDLTEYSVNTNHITALVHTTFTTRYTSSLIT